MNEIILGVILTIVFPFAVLGFATISRKFGASIEFSRKLVHILLSNWILLAINVYENSWYICILPAIFIPLNYLSCRKGIFSAIERDHDGEKTLGTFWYAVSLFLLCLFGYLLKMPWIAACGMLAMGYGDGLGALIGQKFGKLTFPGVHSKKTIEGTLAVMIFSGLSVGIVCLIYVPHFALYAALSCAVPAGALELFSPRGLDNITLPIGVSLIVFLLATFPFLLSNMICLSITLFILIIAYYLKAITFWGMISAICLGMSLHAFGGWISYIALVMFFIVGSIVSKIGKNKKLITKKIHEHYGARSVIQVAANGLPSLFFAVLYYCTGIESYLLAVLICFAAATADTFSSEIGMLSKKTPVSILTLKPIQRGMSGGITLLGLFSGAIGAFIISLLTIPKFGLNGMLATLFIGLFSSLLDSILGAVFQAKYQFENDKKEIILTECPNYDGKSLKLVHGIRCINNDMVNFLSVFLIGLAVSFI